MLNGDPEPGLDDLLQSRSREQPRQIAFACARELRLVLDGWIELVHSLPVHVQRPMAAAVIPHRRCNDASVARDARHLTQPSHGICHEVDDELRERGVELPLGERQLLRSGAFDGHARVAFANCVDERLRRIDGRHGVLAEPLHELRRQRARPAADVEHTTLGSRRSRRTAAPAAPSTGP